MVNQFENNNPAFLDSTVLDSFDMGSVNKWTYLGYESLFFIFFFLAAWAGMTFMRYQSR